MKVLSAFEASAAALRRASWCAVMLLPLVVVVPPPAIADSYTLKCTLPDGEPVADLTIDLDRMVMSWGSTPYKITAMTDRYITAIKNVAAETPDADIGGEIFVLDRVTGDYKRAHVGMFCKDSSCRTGNTVLEAHACFGRCVRAMF